MKDLSLMLMEKFQTYKRGYKPPAGRSNTAKKRTKRKGELVIMRRRVNSRENK